MPKPADRARFDREVAKYPPDQKQSAVMACLAIVQQADGHLPHVASDNAGAQAARQSARGRDAIAQLL